MHLKLYSHRLLYVTVFLWDINRWAMIGRHHNYIVLYNGRIQKENDFFVTRHILSDSPRSWHFPIYLSIKLSSKNLLLKVSLYRAHSGAGGGCGADLEYFHSSFSFIQTSTRCQVPWDKHQGIQTAEKRSSSPSSCSLAHLRLFIQE